MGKPIKSVNYTDWELKKMADNREGQIKEIEARVTRRKTKLAGIEDKSETNPAARKARKRLKRAQRSLVKAKNYRSVTLAKLAAKQAAAAPSGGEAPAEAPAEG